MASPKVDPAWFDGSLVEVYDRELTLRLKEILDRVLDRKACGQGALARPEANIGIVEMLCILHQLDGGTQWIEEAVVTYIRTLDWALRNSADVCWRFEWLSPVRGDPLFRDVFDTLYHSSPEKSTLLSTYRAAVGDSAEFGRMHQLLRERVTSANKLVGYPPVVLSKSAETDIPPLPDNFPASRYEASVIPEWPSKSKKYRERVPGLLLCRLTDQLGGDAWVAYVRRKILTDPDFAAGGKRDPEKGDPWVFSPHGASALVAIEFYDRLLGVDGAVGRLLSAVLGASVLQQRIASWTRRFPGLEPVFTALLVNDSVHLSTWARLIRDAPPRMAKLYRPLWESVRAYIESDDSASLSPSAVKGKVNQATVRAFTGLLRRDAVQVNEGIRLLLDSYCKSDAWREWGQSESVDLCIPAVALQRAALRHGIGVDIPDDKKNDMELVLAPDPSEPSLDFFPYPGIELALKTPGLPWPVLFLGKHVPCEDPS